MSDDPHIDSYTDEELVSLSLDDTSFFAMLIERYSEKMKRYLRRITSVSEEDREDMVQNIFIKIYTNLRGFNTDLSFNAWIYRIAHNESIDWNRKHKTKTNFGVVDVEDQIMQELIDDQEKIYTHYDHEHLKKIMTDVFNQMKPIYRDVLVLKFVEGLSYRDISDTLKKPEGTIATLIHRAKADFKKHYQHHQHHHE